MAKNTTSLLSLILFEILSELVAGELFDHHSHFMFCKCLSILVGETQSIEKLFFLLGFSIGSKKI
jgi:hypothetical protein